MKKNTSKKTNSKSSSKKREDKINKFFNNLSFATIDLVDEFYAAEAKFIDPINQHNGVNAIKSYYANLYKNVEEISFDLDQQIITADTHVLPWKMKLRTQAINKGEIIVVEGISLLKFNQQNQISYHRDYFDMGEFVYEKIPVLKSIISYIKKRMQGK